VGVPAKLKQTVMESSNRMTRGIDYQMLPFARWLSLSKPGHT